MARAHILKLNASGLPICLIDQASAVNLLMRGKIIWSIGGIAVTLHGGMSRKEGEVSVLRVPSIISVRDRSDIWNSTQPMRAARQVIYGRDEGLCMYCGDPVGARGFELDHIVPKSRGGPDTYTNLVCSCRGCNARKGDKTLEEAGMKLLAVPYTPNPAARLILSGRAVIADQMEYLKGYANLRRSLSHKNFRLEHQRNRS